MDIAKEAGIDKIGFASRIDSAEGERMQRALIRTVFVFLELREMVDGRAKSTGEEARERYEKAFPRSKED